MSIRIVVSPLVRFKVEGRETGEDGADVPFDFFLVAERLKDTQAVRAFRQLVSDREALKSDTPITDALMTKLRDWVGAMDEHGQAAPWSEAACRELLGRPGLAALAYHAFIDAVSVKEKNS